MLLVISSPDKEAAQGLCKHVAEHIQSKYPEYFTEYMSQQEEEQDSKSNVDNLIHSLLYYNNGLSYPSKEIFLNMVNDKHNILILDSYYSNKLMESCLNIDSLKHQSNSKSNVYALLTHMIDVLDLPKPMLNIVYLPETNKDYDDRTNQLIDLYRSTLNLSMEYTAFCQHNECIPPIYITNLNNILSYRLEDNPKFNTFFDKLQEQAYTYNLSQKVIIEQVYKTVDLFIDMTAYLSGDNNKVLYMENTQEEPKLKKSVCKCHKCKHGPTNTTLNIKPLDLEEDKEEDVTIRSIDDILKNKYNFNTEELVCFNDYAITFDNVIKDYKSYINQCNTDEKRKLVLYRTLIKFLFYEDQFPEYEEQRKSVLSTLRSELEKMSLSTSDLNNYK